jgi:hypothetical protein
LAVDDNPAALYATARVLRSAGYEVVQAATGSAALAAAPHVDLVVLDINLPDMDGFEVCRRLRAHPDTAQLPVLHLSATFTQTSDFDLGLEAGADSYLTRPVEAPVLLATVRTLLFARHADFIRRGLDAKLRTMFKLAPISIAMLDQSLQYESVNPAFCALTGYAAEELVGLPAATVFGSHAEAFELSPESAGHDKPKEGRLVFARKDGSTAHAEWRLASEAISGVRILVLADISYQVRNESERENLLAREKAARAEAERSNQLKEEFLATLSHELRNPLNAILGWATILSRAEGLPPNVMRGVQAIERNSKLQAQMIADLLDYAGIAFGKIRLTASTIDPYLAVRAAVDVVHAAAVSQKVEVRISFGEESVAVEADPARMQQIVWNLLSNAIKFSSPGGIVEVHAARFGDSFRLVVRDHGRGISPHFLPRIFERFSQQDSSSTKNYGGLGLGLAIVKQLVELHGGTIEVFSGGEGQGATFTVTIPLSDKQPALPLSDSQLTRLLNLSDVVALVVDDDADARDLMKQVLTDAGATVIIVSSAQAALDSVKSSGANILISDISMPGRDGYELIRSVRASGFGVDVLPALAVTAFARMQDRAEALAAGFQDHIVKPIDPSELISRVSSLRRRRLPSLTQR